MIIKRQGISCWTCAMDSHTSEHGRKEDASQKSDDSAQALQKAEDVLGDTLRVREPGRDRIEAQNGHVEAGQSQSSISNVVLEVHAPSLPHTLKTKIKKIKIKKKKIIKN